MKKLGFFIFVFLLINMILVSASVSVSSVDVGNLYPGEEERLNVEIENNFDYTIEDVSLKLELENLPISTVGSSEKSVDEIDDDDEDDFSFTIRASADINPGDYDVPYTITYKDDENEVQEKRGTIGVRVSSETELDFSVESENAIVGRNGRINLNIVNRGFGEVKFVSVRIIPSGFDLLSAESVYIGNIDSDDFEVASYDVYFKSRNPVITFQVQYKDFENNGKTETVNLPLRVYSQEEAIELGLIGKNNSGIYIYIVIFLVIIWVVWRIVKKRRKNKKK